MQANTIVLSDGRRFPLSATGKVLSWSIGLYNTLAQERLGYPDCREVIRAMITYRPEQLHTEKRDLLKSSMADRLFGHNAKKMYELICEVEMELA